MKACSSLRKKPEKDLNNKEIIYLIRGNKNRGERWFGKNGEHGLKEQL